MSSADSPDRDEELVDLLADLETTLTELRSELGADGRNGSDRPGRDDVSGRSDRRDASEPQHRVTGRRRDRSSIPRPPSASELFRFTEQYTLPTLISTLEATIRALELLRGMLRLLDGRSAFDDADEGSRSSARRLGDGVAGIGRGAVSGAERALAELETALSESEIPEDRAEGDLLRDARELSAEIAERLDAAQGGRGDRGGSQRDRDPSGREADRGTNPESGPVTIEVTDGDDTAPETGDDDEGPESPPEVDVEAELESIRHEVRSRDESSESGAGEGADADGNDGDDGDADSEDADTIGSDHGSPGSGRDDGDDPAA